MSIQHIIVHELAKEPQEKVIATLRIEENLIDEHAERVSSQLASLFTAMSIGGFHRPANSAVLKTPFETLLAIHFDGQDFNGFAGFSQAASELLEQELNKPTAQQAKGGYLLFNHYLHGGKAFLSVVLLRMRQGTTLKGDLSFADVEELNLDKLHMAARINLTDWLAANGDRYIAFKIGRQARDLTDYFSEFIGCREYRRAKTDTRALVHATRDFCDRRELSEPDTLSARRAVDELVRDRLEKDVQITLDDISTLLDTLYPPENDVDRGLFLAIAQDNYQLTNTPAIDRTILRQLVRFSGKTRKLSISFDAEMLEDGGISYDSQSKSLTINDLPESLIQDLEKTTNPSS